MKKKNLGGRPPKDPYIQRTRPVKFTPKEEDDLKQLGYSLQEGARLALREFIERGKRNVKQQ